MSYKVKPEDISEELQERCWVHARGGGASQRWSISEILNAAVEAGLVSPPCWVMRCNGRMTKDMNREPNLYPSPRGGNGAVTYEHWKGQTE